MTTAVSTKPLAPAAQPKSEQKGKINESPIPLAPVLPPSVPEPPEEKEVEGPSGSVSPPQVKTITFTKITGDKWKVEFGPEIKRRDINHLRRVMIVQWNRSKRDQRVERLKKDRKERRNGTAE